MTWPIELVEVSSRSGDGDYFDALARLAELHGGVDRDVVVHAKIDSGSFERLESRSLDRNVVRTRIQVGQQVIAAFIGGGVATHARSGVQAFDLGSNEYGAAGIGDAPQERAPGFLADERKLNGGEQSGGEDETRFGES